MGKDLSGKELGEGIIQRKNEIVETKFDAINNVKKLPIRDDSMVV